VRWAWLLGIAAALLVAAGVALAARRGEGGWAAWLVVAVALAVIVGAALAWDRRGAQ